MKKLCKRLKRKRKQQNAVRTTWSSAVAMYTGAIAAAKTYNYEFRDRIQKNYQQ
jgi:thioredoxin-related protein